MTDSLSPFAKTKTDSIRPVATLTAEEREAVGRAAGLIGDTVANDSEQAMGDFLALRGLLERTK